MNPIDTLGERCDEVFLVEHGAESVKASVIVYLGIGYKRIADYKSKAAFCETCEVIYAFRGNGAFRLKSFKTHCRKNKSVLHSHIANFKRGKQMGILIAHLLYSFLMFVKPGLTILSHLNFCNQIRQNAYLCLPCSKVKHIRMLGLCHKAHRGHNYGGNYNPDSGNIYAGH